MADYPAFHIDDTVLPFGRPVLPVGLENMCRVYWRYLSPDGRPIAGRTTVFGNIQVPHLAVQGVMVGNQVEARTDENGKGYVYLLRGMECEVVINETHITRRIMVPNEPSARLEDLISDAPDVFSIQRAMPTTPIRRSI